MLTVTAALSVREDKIEEFEAAIAEARPAMLADEGCLRYDLQRVNGSPNSYVMLEVYDSGDAIRRHGELDAFKALSGKLAELLTAEPVITVLKPVGEQTS